MSGDSAGGIDESIGGAAGFFARRGGIDIAAQAAMADSPSNGDVLITTEGGRHLLSVFPHPHRLAMNEYHLALQIASKWAAANNVSVWRNSDGVLTKLPRD